MESAFAVSALVIIYLLVASSIIFIAFNRRLADNTKRRVLPYLWILLAIAAFGLEIWVPFWLSIIFIVRGVWNYITEMKDPSKEKK